MNSSKNYVNGFAEFQGESNAHSKLLLSVLVPNLGLGLVASVLAYLLMEPWVTAPQLLSAWLLAQVTTSLFRLGLGIHNPHWIAPPHPAHKASLVSHTVFSGIAGILWGSAFFMLTPQFNPTIELLLAAVLGAITILVTTSYYVHPAVRVALLIPMMLLTSVWAVTALQPVYLWIAAALPALTLVLVLLVFRRHDHKSPTIRMQLQNSLLQRDYLLKNAMLGREIDERQVLEEDLRRNLKLFMKGPVVTYRCHNANGRRIIRWVSDNIRDYGFFPESLIGTAWDDLIFPEDTEQVMDTGRTGSEPTELRLRCADGSYKWIYDYTIPVRDEDNLITVYDGYFIDITGLHLAHDELAREKERAHVTLASIGDAVITTDPEGIISFMNSAAERLTGCSEAEMTGKQLNQALQIRRDGIMDWIEDPLSYYLARDDGSAREHLKAEFRSRTGEHGQLTYRASPIRNGGPHVYGYVLVLLDVTENEELQDELEFQARHDDLTGIYNRWEFENRFQMLLDACRQDESNHMLLYLDLDQFKLVNDTCGHHAGDELLRQLTALYGATLDNNAVLARVGGDEFGILLASCNIEEGLRIAEELRDTTRDFNFAWDGRVFQVGVSIGIVPVNRHSESMHDLLGAADVACYAAKEQGRNHIRLHKDSDSELLQRRKDMNWAGRLTDSMANGEFKLYYQDIVPVCYPGKEKLRRIEILLRLKNEDGDPVSAETFLPSAERYNLMPELDRWVVRESFSWYESLGGELAVKMNINLSGLSFTNPGFLEFLEALFDEYEVPPSAVCFEVTETAAIQNLSTARKFIQQLRQKGCSFALDDFGSGVSSFEYLKALPVDYVKIDGKFVTDISNNRVDRAVVGAINDVGHTMKLHTIAEYVESDEIFEELVRMKVDFAQGYGVGRPQPLENLMVKAAA